MKALISVLLTSAIFLLPASPASAADTCIDVAGMRLLPSQVYDERHLCGTCPGQTKYVELCSPLNKIMVPYLSAEADIVVIPHRGLWGQPIDQGPAENTLNAFQAANFAGYDVIEVDAAMTGPDPVTKEREVFLGHYFSMIAAGGSSSKQPRDYSPTELNGFRQRKRDQTLSSDKEDRLASLKEVIDWAKFNRIILTIDPKIPANAAPNEYDEIIAKVLTAALDQDALANIVIKTTSNYNEAVRGIELFLGEDFQKKINGRFLWSPICNKSSDVTLDDAKFCFSEWQKNTSTSRQVLTYEAQIYSQSHWSAKPFEVSGVRYNNLLDYIVRLGVKGVGKRPALWSIDPQGDKGTLGREYNWKFVGNTRQGDEKKDDLRGNPLYNLQTPGALYTAIITDRPDWYGKFTSNPYN